MEITRLHFSFGPWPNWISVIIDCVKSQLVRSFLIAHQILAVASEEQSAKAERSELFLLSLPDSKLDQPVFTSEVPL